MFGGQSVGSATFSSVAPNPAASLTDLYAIPFRIYLNNVESNGLVQVETLSIDDTLGEQASCTLTIINPTTAPNVGDSIRVTQYSAVLFAGTVDRIKKTADLTYNILYYECQCTGWEQILYRYKIRRNFTNQPLQNIVTSLLQNELAGEGLTLGTVDRGTSIPLVDSNGGSAFDVLRNAAGVTGQTFYVDWDKSLQFRISSNTAAPITLNDAVLEDAQLTTDRETYRNVQIVKVTGTVPDGSNATALTTVQTRQNDNQIAARQAIEGGSGRYEMYEEITHPTSNDGAQIALLGIGYANLLLATSGTLRQTLQARVRSYGFRAGQFATVSVPTLGLSGTWLIQRVRISDQVGRDAIHELELVQSSLQQRAYESWLSIVKGGKITVQMPSAVTSNLQTYNTPGTYYWTVPAGVTLVEVTCIGAGGGGGGASYYRSLNSTSKNGYAGGTGGKAILSVTVTPLESLTVIVGAAGTAGINGVYTSGFGWFDGTAGANGGYTNVNRSSTVLCQANPGTGGGDGHNGPAGQNGSGIGDAVSVGGGSSGGAGGVYAVSQPVNGNDGTIEIRW